jgi:hypothetical protein
MQGAVFVVVAVLFGALGYKLGQRKNRAIEGLILGAILGLIGIVILHFLKPKDAAPTAQTWDTSATYGTPAPNAYAEQAGFGTSTVRYGQAVLPGTQQAAPVATPQPPVSAVPPQWFADPSGRHQHRWWDGNAWTEHVADNGVVSVDAPLPAQPF